MRDTLDAIRAALAGPNDAIPAEVMGESFAMLAALPAAFADHPHVGALLGAIGDITPA